MLAPSIGSAKYHLKFQDECSGFTWGEAIEDKSGHTILGAFRQLCALVKTQYGEKVKALQSDNGTEYVNSGMAAFLNEKGIVHRTSAPKRHEMNGTAERVNRTGANTVRAMLLSANLPYEYWAEAYVYVLYIQNRVPHHFLKTGTSPYKILHHQKP